MRSSAFLMELVKSSLVYTSEEMAVALRRSAFSPNIRERADHTCALLDAQGRLLGQAEQIPVHIGSLPLGLRNTLAYLEEVGTEPRPGDMYVVNDPYIAGTHLNDVTLIRPVFYHGALVGYTANKAHHVDVGGMGHASITMEARELIQEGLVMPPIKLMEANELRREVVELIRANTRIPETALGDLRAQVAANIMGERRLLELVSRLGLEAYRGACEELLEYTNRLCRAAYARMPKGSWEAEDYLELGERLIRIRVKVKIQDEGVEVDFTGTDAQVEAPLNAVLGVTTAAATYVVRTLLPAEVPINEGFTGTIRVKAPEGTIVNPKRPAPVAAGNVETSQRIVDTIYRALADALPDRIPAASHGSMNNLMMGGIHPGTGRSWVFYETIGGGGGARPGMDGVDGVHVHMTNTMNTPIEVMEHYYPLRFVSYRFRDHSAGAGEWRGGMGIERAFTATATIHVTVIGERCRIRPWGLRGGQAGAPAQYLLRRASGEVRPLRSKDSVVLNPGDTLVIRTAGGGGYGDPRRRPPELVELDRENNAVFLEGAS
jgi:N-methylhydantoinase B